MPCRFWIDTLRLAVGCLLRPPSDGGGIGQWLSDDDTVFTSNTSPFLISLVASIARYPHVPHMAHYHTTTNSSSGSTWGLEPGYSFDYGFPILVSDYWLRTRGYLRLTRLDQISAQKVVDDVEAVIAPKRFYSYAITVDGIRTKYSRLDLCSESRRTPPIPSTVPAFEVLTPASLLQEASNLDQLVTSSKRRKKTRLHGPPIHNGFEAYQDLTIRICLYSPFTTEIIPESVLLAAHRVYGSVDNSPQISIRPARGDHPLPSPPDTELHIDDDSRNGTSNSEERLAEDEIQIRDFQLVLSQSPSLYIYEGVIPRALVLPNTYIILDELRTSVAGRQFTQKLSSEVDTLNQLYIQSAQNSPQSRLERSYPPILIPSEAVSMSVTCDPPRDRIFHGEIVDIKITFASIDQLRRLYISATNGLIRRVDPYGTDGEELPNGRRLGKGTWHNKMEIVQLSKHIYLQLHAHALADSACIRVAIGKIDRTLLGRDICTRIDPSVTVTSEFINESNSQGKMLYKAQNQIDQEFDVWLKTDTWREIGSIEAHKWTSGVFDQCEGAKFNVFWTTKDKRWGLLY